MAVAQPPQCHRQAETRLGRLPARQRRLECGAGIYPPALSEGNIRIGGPLHTHADHCPAQRRAVRTVLGDGLVWSVSMDSEERRAGILRRDCADPAERLAPPMARPGDRTAFTQVIKRTRSPPTFWQRRT